MTATLPQQGPPTQGGPTAVRRVRSVYGIPIRDVVAGQVRIDYVGKTKRAVAVREAEHRGLGRNPEDEQPWSDLIEGHAIVLESDERLPDDQKWSDAKLGEREQWWIRNLTPYRPRYNWEFNADCPGQIPKWVAAEQRAERDRARGVVSRWTNPELFAPVSPRPAPARPVPGRPGTLWGRLWASPAGRRVSAWLRAAVKVAAVWLALSVVGTGVAIWSGFNPGDSAEGAAFAAAALVGCVIYRKHNRRPRRGGRTNRTIRRRRT
jgi:hypothetical protein